MNNSFVDSIVLLNESNRFFYSKLNTSFGAVIISDKEKIYISDSRYEYYLKQNLIGWTIVNSSGAELYKNISKELFRIGAKIVGYEDNTILKSQYDALKNSVIECELIPHSKAIRDIRAIKNIEMIEYVAEAQKISEITLNNIIPQIKIGVTEREIAAKILYELSMNGAEGPSFEPIVAFGENSAKPHHHPSYKKYEKGDIILIDMGAKYNGYCSDMTRTFALDECNKEFLTIHQIVTEAQKYGLKMIKSGIQCGEVDTACREYITANGFEKEFSHSTGHGVGINIHEYPSVSAGSIDELKDGMIITVEPGIYIKGLGGIRMEDIVVVTKDGIKNLTNFSKNFYFNSKAKEQSPK